MPFNFTPITESDARQMLMWQYQEPYGIYNADPEEIEESIHQDFLQPAYHYHSIRNEAGELIGYCSFNGDAQVKGGDYSAEALDIGAGMRPDLTGQGYGAVFLAAILGFARQTFAPHTFRLTIVSWNDRAQRMAQSAGFRHEQTFMNPNDTEFVILTRQA